jgi:hypothetical protein
MRFASLLARTIAASMLLAASDVALAAAPPVQEIAPPQTAQSCRQGAFMEAEKILGSVVNVDRLLPKETPEVARAELDSILYTALKMARSEMHCVSGVLTNGFDRSFADTARRAVALAKARGLKKDVVLLGEEIVQQLERETKPLPKRLPFIPSESK